MGSSPLILKIVLLILSKLTDFYQEGSSGALLWEKHGTDHGVWLGAQYIHTSKEDDQDSRQSKHAVVSKGV